MKIQHLVLNFLLLIFTISGYSQEVKLDGFSHPESVVFDGANDLFYVSNMANREPGDGFISKLSAEGELLEAVWIDGLNDPKGLLVLGEKLYVTDNKELVEIDIQGGNVARKIAVPNAASLNDIAIDEEGSIFISDMGKNAIYRIDNTGRIEEWLNNPELNTPNGVLVDGDKLLVASWGNNESPGNLLQVDRKSKQVSPVTTTGIGNLDGIQRIDDDSFFVSDWATGKVYEILLTGEQKEILTSEKSSGDILFLKDKNQLYLPMNRQNQVWIYNLD